MEILRASRLKRGITLQQLSEATGISVQRLSEYELAKRNPRAATLVNIANALGIVDLLIPNKSFRRGTRRRAYTQWVRCDFRDTWNDLDTAYVNFVDVTGVEIPAWFRAMVRCDSALEALAWLLLIYKGAQSQISSPYLEGFDRHPMVDAEGRAVGSKLLACLSWKVGGVRYVLWPQVWLRTHRYTYRVDALLRVEVGGRVCWVAGEIDGDGHNNRYDARRTRDLDIPVVRFSQTEVESVHFPALLCKRTKRELGLAPKAEAA